MGLHCPSPEAVDAFKAAALAGDVWWHALPHNAQVELFNGPSLLAAVDVAHALDRQFGMAPKLTASQRDVPGLTRAALPLLVVAGVRALSLGLNPGAPPAAWPLNTPFFWVDRASGARALTMVHPGGYSGTPVDSKNECITAVGLEHALCCAWKNDNAGPHTVEEVLAIYERVGGYWPGARVSDSNFDAFNARLLEMTDGGEIVLPEFDREVGERGSGGWEREVCACVCVLYGLDQSILFVFSHPPPPPFFPQATSGSTAPPLTPPSWPRPAPSCGRAP
jgi:hypothetical protein